MSEKQNPYTLVFGREPSELITRTAQAQSVIDVFSSIPPSQQVYMITGVRGSGKTVFMTSIADHFKKQEDWITIELNPSRDMLTSLAAKLGSRSSLARMFQSASINLSLFGIGLGVKGSVPIADIETALEKMLESIKKHGKKVLITVDEVTASQYMKEFCSSFQIFVRNDLPVYMLMTGLFENIELLRNTPNLTFLYRATRVPMNPLNQLTIADNYQRIFQLNRESSIEMASWTKGYSFAFQVLGYFTWEHDGNYHDAWKEFYSYLSEYSYIKIWSGLSVNDRKVTIAVAKSESGRSKEIREFLGWTTDQFNPYRMRLIRKGLLDGETYGQVRFTLPEFGRFILEYSELLGAE